MKTGTVIVYNLGPELKKYIFVVVEEKQKT
jgi:hypothetical protein